MYLFIGGSVENILLVLRGVYTKDVVEATDFGVKSLKQTLLGR